MAATKTCPSCGFDKNPPQFHPLRLVRPEDGKTLGKAVRTREEELERRYQQEGISIQWLAIALTVQGVLTAALVFGLPMVIPCHQSERENNGMTVCIPVWFVGGMLVGLISPGRTFIEPVVASFVVAIPTTFFLIDSETVRTLPTFLYVIMAAIGVLFTLIGAYIGERIPARPGLPKQRTEERRPGPQLSFLSRTRAALPARSRR